MSKVRAHPAFSGILVIDKPAGCTSHDVVARIRRLLGIQRVGHAGTLDPMASGVLIVAVGEATKLTALLAADIKGYEATVAFGSETNTLDADGEVTSTAIVPDDTLEALAAPERSARLADAIELERHRTRQVPPVVSAIHDRGERAHVRARRGEEVVLDARDVFVRALDVMHTQRNPPILSCRLIVSKGYYVRAFARDLGRSLGTVSTLIALRRTRSGVFDAAEAVALPSDADALVRHMIPTEVAARRALPSVTLDDEQATCARQGKPVVWRPTQPRVEPVAAWFDQRGALVALGAFAPEGVGRVVRGFGPSVPPL